MVPPDIAPLATLLAPAHINKVIAPKISSITTLVIAERMRLRRRAVAKVRSTASAKRWASRAS